MTPVRDCFPCRHPPDACMGRGCLDAPVRTSLDRSPSGYTAEQVRERARREAARAWHGDTRILLVAIDDDRLTWPERELLTQLGNRLHGKGVGR